MEGRCHVDAEEAGDAEADLVDAKCGFPIDILAFDEEGFGADGLGEPQFADAGNFVEEVAAKLVLVVRLCVRAERAALVVGQQKKAALVLAWIAKDRLVAVEVAVVHEVGTGGIGEETCL